jgi:hypothetical protein
MTASVATPSRNPERVRRSTTATLAIAILAGSIVFGLLIGAVTFGALALAFPLAVPIAQQYHVSVSANDMLIAEQFAHLWWVFAAFSIGCLVAAAAVVIKTLSYLEPRYQG